MNIAELKAGQELDALIAEKVFGWAKLCGVEIPEFLVQRDLNFYKPHLAAIWVNEQGEMMACKECGNMPNFSEEISAAWKVISYMKEQLFSRRKKFFCELQRLASLKIDSNSVSLWNVAWPDILFFLTPEIICFAALAAMENE